MKFSRTSAENGLRTVFAAAFLAFIVAFACLLAPKLTARNVRHPAALFPLKKSFVELNGACCRMGGRRLCNGVAKSGDGVLVNGSRVVLNGQERAAVRFANWLKESDVEYVFVQAPGKMDLNLDLLPPCMEYTAYHAANRLLETLSDAGVETIDFRQEFAADANRVAQYFYRTDHHWNNDAVFLAFKRIAARLGYAVDGGDWTRSVVEDCFLGSKGRRTGRLFCGLDDMILYRPKFKTRMSLDIPSANVHVSGSFLKTNMRNASKIRSGKANGRAYSQAYVGEIAPIAFHRNGEAPVRLRVLMIGDSFVRPLEAFLSTAVTDLCVVDPRRYRKGTIADCVRSFKPDIVLQIQNPSALASDYMVGKPSGKAVFFAYGSPDEPECSGSFRVD